MDYWDRIKWHSIQLVEVPTGQRYDNLSIRKSSVRNCHWIYENPWVCKNVQERRQKYINIYWSPFEGTVEPIPLWQLVNWKRKLSIYPASPGEIVFQVYQIVPFDRETALPYRRMAIDIYIWIGLRNHHGTTTKESFNSGRINNCFSVKVCFFHLTSCPNGLEVEIIRWMVEWGTGHWCGVPKIPHITHRKEPSNGRIGALLKLSLASRMVKVNEIGNKVGQTWNALCPWI